MNRLSQDNTGKTLLLMGNEAIARGVIESGASVCAAYPGNPSSDIIDALAKESSEVGIHVEWSVNEKVALEVAASAAMVGLRGFAAMKQNGLNVASDFLLNLNLSGIRGGLVLAVCDDPSGISSTNEQDSRLFARMGELPLLEPSDFQEAKDMVKEAFDLSEILGLPVIVHSVTRLSHARGNVSLGSIRKPDKTPYFDRSKPFINVPAPAKAHLRLKEKIVRCREIVEESPFNSYTGPERPELLIITAGAGRFYCEEAIHNLAAENRVGMLKVASTFPLPRDLILKRLTLASTVLFVEEGGPFLEEGVKEIYADHVSDLNVLKLLGKSTGELPSTGELNTDLIIDLLSQKLGVQRKKRPDEYHQGVGRAASNLVPARDLAFCAGCPHRATYWAIKKALTLDGRDGFVCGDIGCYGMGSGPAGWSQMDTMQAMGSGTGVACGMGLLNAFGLEQPVIAVCGDSTFYHAAIPALINARQHESSFLLLILDNSATAMTGFQPHPGLGKTATGKTVPIVGLEDICRAIGCPVETVDPYDLGRTTESILQGLESPGVKVLILKQTCALVRAKQGLPHARVKVDQEKCIGDRCGCSRYCTRVFKCPGLIWDTETGTARIDEAMCTGCGVCVQICPECAIVSEEA